MAHVAKRNPDRCPTHPGVCCGRCDSGDGKDKAGCAASRHFPPHLYTYCASASGCLRPWRCGSASCSVTAPEFGCACKPLTIPEACRAERGRREAPPNPRRDAQEAQCPRRVSRTAERAFADDAATRPWRGGWESCSRLLCARHAMYRRRLACAPKLRRRRQTTCRVEPPWPATPVCARAICHRDAGGKCREAAQSRPWSFRSPELRPPAATRRDGSGTDPDCAWRHEP